MGRPLLLGWRLFITGFVLCPQPVRCDYHSYHKTNKTHTCWEFYLFLLQWYCFFLTLSMAIKLKVYSGDECFMGPKHPWMVSLQMPRIKRHGHSLNEQLLVIQKSKIAKPHILKEWTYFFFFNDKVCYSCTVSQTHCIVNPQCWGGLRTERTCAKDIWISSLFHVPVTLHLLTN